MPVITRSTTGPTRMMTGVKRKFIEILESDDETDTQSDSDFEPDIADVLEDEIDELKDDLKETEESNDALINLLIKERENVQALHIELEDMKKKHAKLIQDVKEVQNTVWWEVVAVGTMLAAAAGASLAAFFVCAEENYY